MWRVILLVFCYHVVSQPVTDEPSTRHTRELIECCPCPGSNGRIQLSRAMDDCPCRVRDADSEGSSSMLFPTQPEAGKSFNSVPFMRSNDPKDEMKNLLEPEVGLATSMLQTLREATEEEYRDAVARDAARSSDAVPEESATNVVIIVKPRGFDDDDAFISEASNVKETRCIQPLGSSLGRMRSVSKPLRTLPDLSKLPQARQPLMYRNLWDIDNNVGASNVQENIGDTVGGTAEKLPLFKLTTPVKENPLSSINGDGLKTPSVFEKLEQSLKNRPSLFERFNLPQIPKIKLDNPLQLASNNVNTDSDLSPAPSLNVQEFIENEDGKENGVFKFNKRPLMLKNLLKLKDVELIPRTIPKIPIFKTKFNMKDSSLNREADNKCEDSSDDSAMNENQFMPENEQTDEIFEAQNVCNGGTCLQNIGQNVAEFDKKNQDAITSPSEIIPTVIDNTKINTVESKEIDCNKVSSEEIITSNTELISTTMQDENNFNETLNPSQLSEIEDITENDEDSKITKSFETEVVENGNLEIDSSNNIVDVIPFTSQDNEDSISQPEFEELGLDIINPLHKVDEDFTPVRSSEDESQSGEPIFSVISNKNNVPKIIPQTETLSTIRDNVKSIENLKNTNLNGSPTNLQSDINSNTLNTDYFDQETRRDETAEEIDDWKSKFKENPDQISLKDLQKKSDELLVLSSKNENESSESDCKSNEALEQNEEVEPDNLEAEPTILSSKESSKGASAKLTTENACHIGFEEIKSKPKPVQQSKSVHQDEDTHDMSVQASAPTANILPTLLDPLNLNEQLGSSLFQNIDPLDPFQLNENLGSPLLPKLEPLNLNKKLKSSELSNIDPLNLNENLKSPILSDINPLNLNEKYGPSFSTFDPLNVRSSLQDIIVQPTIPDDPLKTLLGKPITEVLKLPTLEDLRQRLTSVFDSDKRSAENNFSDEDGDCLNDAPEMASAASTTSIRKVPPISPYEDFNVDLFQLNPLSSSQPNVLSKVPRLNLKNFRTKLPIPTNLDLKPVKLESRIGNNKGNVLGASLTFGNDRVTSRKPTPIHANLLGHPLSNLPSLDELRNTLHSGTQNLLGTPLQPKLDMLRDSPLRSSVIPDIDEIRRNAEKTMKGLQQKIKSTFKGQHGRINNPLNEKFARPEDLLEDVNDKLKAIHYDLNDRLSSIHEDFLDQSRLKNLLIPARIPTFPSFPTNRNPNRNVINTIRKTKGKPARLQTSASTKSSQEIDPLENTNERNLFQSEAKNSFKRVQTKPHKSLAGAESSPVPSKVVFPKSRTTMDIPRKSLSPPLLQRLPNLRHSSENIFPERIRENPLNFPKTTSFGKELKKPILGKSNPFKDKNSKVTITFASTTPSPVTSPLEKYSTADAKQSATEFTPLRMSTPLKPKNNFKTASSDMKNLPQIQSIEPIEDTKSRLSNFKGIKDSKMRLNKNNANRLNSARAFDNNKPEETQFKEIKKSSAKPLTWPKSGDGSFLAKVREAMQARLASFDPTKAIKAAENVEALQKVERPNTDMMRSASENKDVLVEAPLKESVPYKCRMVCTRE